MMHYRHGDLLIVPTDELPRDAQKVKRVGGRLVLAEGEVTGHAHAIADRSASLYELVAPGDVTEMRQRFLAVESRAALTHEEHGTIELPAGIYQVFRQVEDTGRESWRVAD
jgi:hypothetical protein